MKGRQRICAETNFLQKDSHVVNTNGPDVLPAATRANGK